MFLRRLFSKPDTKTLLEIGVSLISLAAAGMLLFSQYNNASERRTLQSPATGAQPQQHPQINTEKAGDAVNVTPKSYVAHILRQYDNTVPSQTAYDMYDSSTGAHAFISTINGIRSTEIFSGEHTYNCNDQKCTKYQGPHPDNTRQFAYAVGPEVLTQLKQRGSRQASETCGDAMCSVWQIAAEDMALTPFTEKLYISDTTRDVQKRIRTYVQTGYVVTVSYEYRAVAIPLPPTPGTLPQP